VRSFFALEGEHTMNVEITGRHVVITPAIRAYVLKKLGKFSKILGDDINFHVIIDVEKERHTAEILLKSKMLELTGKGQSDDMYKSIMSAIEKLERQALKHKGKLIEGKRQKAKAKSVANKLGVGEPTSRALDSKGSKVREELVRKKPMEVEEAVLELDKSGYPFVVFRNIESGEVNVLYRRKDGILGLIRG
jgi:putative sigma-54 modulation protein